MNYLKMNFIRTAKSVHHPANSGQTVPPSPQFTVPPCVF